MKRCHSYRHSLRSYVSMLYLQWPKVRFLMLSWKQTLYQDFKIIVRGKEVIPVPVTSGMKHVAVYEYRPRSLPKEEPITSETKGIPFFPCFGNKAISRTRGCTCLRWVRSRSSGHKCFWFLCLSSKSFNQAVLESLYKRIECGTRCNWISSGGFCRTRS